MNDELLKTTLHQVHINANAKLVPFAGWDMPIQYSSILKECNAVRNKSGIFDVSHMGRFMISGPKSALALDKILSIDPNLLKEGQGKYNLICNSNGGIIDDCIVYKIAKEEFLLIPNASNSDKVYKWIKQNTKNLDFNIDIITSNTSMIALQGPSKEIVIGTLFRLRTKEASHFTGYFSESGVAVGAHYRVGDAIIPSMWLEVGNFALGVSYDVNKSNLRTASNARGGMEISLRFINPNPFKYGGGRGNASF